MVGLVYTNTIPSQDTVPFLVEGEYPEEEKKTMDDTEMRAYALSIIAAAKEKELVQANPLHGEELKQALQYFSPNEPAPLTDFAATLTTAPGDELQKVLETLLILERMQCMFPLFRHRKPTLRISNIMDIDNGNLLESTWHWFRLVPGLLFRLHLIFWYNLICSNEKW